MEKTAYTWLIVLVALLPAGSATAMGSSTVSLSVSQAVAYALANNPTLQEAEARIRAAEEAARSSRADLLPEASLNYGFTGLQEKPIQKQRASEIQVSHKNLYNWNITVVQPLFTGFALSTKLDMAKLDIAAKQLEKDQAVLDVTRDVKSACHNLLLMKRLLKVSDQEVEALSAHQRDAELFFREGLIRPNDLLQARVALANSIQQREKVHADVCKAETHLNRLLNRPLDSELKVADINAPPAPLHKAKPDVLGNMAIKQRPLMQLLDTSLRQLHHSLRLAKSAWYPMVALVGQYEQSGDDPGATQNDYSNDHNASISVRVQWKFFQSGKTRAETDGVRRQIDALEAAITRYQNQVCQEVRNSFLDCRTAGNNINTATTALDQAEEHWRITNLQYKQQVATSTDVLDARAFLTQADSNYYRAVYGYMDALAGLDRAIGRK